MRTLRRMRRLLKVTAKFFVLGVQIYKWLNHTNEGRKVRDIIVVQSVKVRRAVIRARRKFQDLKIRGRKPRY